MVVSNAPAHLHRAPRLPRGHGRPLGEDEAAHVAHRGELGRGEGAVAAHFRLLVLGWLEVESLVFCYIEFFTNKGVVVVSFRQHKNSRVQLRVYGQEQECVAMVTLPPAWPHASTTGA